MHIRQVLVKADLEKFQQYKETYNALKKGKVNSRSHTEVYLKPGLRHYIISYVSRGQEAAGNAFRMFVAL